MILKKLGQIKEGQIAMCSIDRNPDAQWKPRYSFDECPTLTTSNIWLWVLSCDDCGQGDEKDRMFSRFLAPEERFLLQGHEASMCTAFGDDLPLAIKAAGNAYPPVFVAAVWAPLICSAPKGTFAEDAPEPSEAALRFRLPTLKKSKMKAKKGKARGKATSNARLTRSR